MSEPEIQSRLELAVREARRAGELTLRYYQSDNLAVEQKADASPVTIADRQAEQLLRDAIAAAFPGDAIVGEEYGQQPGTSGYGWILDPIDGTKSFVAGVPLYGTLVGITCHDEPAAGVIYIPGLDECVYAGRGGGAWHTRGGSSPRPARVSTTANLSDSLFCTTDPKGFTKRGRDGAYRELEAGCRLARTWGDCYGYLLVATGRADVMVDPAMEVWDCAALQPVLEEAGGTFTDWQGRRTIHSREAVGTNGHIAGEVLEILRRFPAGN